MSFAGPRPLASHLPSNDLLSPQVLVSVAGQIAICLIFFYINVAILTSQRWFCSAQKAVSIFKQDSWDVSNGTLANITWPCYPIDLISDVAPNFHVLYASYETTSIWLFSHAQYITVAIALSVYPVSRQSLWANAPFSIFVLFSVPLLGWLFFITDQDAVKLLNLRHELPDDYRFWLAMFALLNLITSCLFEFLVVGRFVNPWYWKRLENQQKQRALKRAKNAGVISSLVQTKAAHAGHSQIGLGLMRSNSAPCAISESPDEDIKRNSQKQIYSPI